MPETEPNTWTLNWTDDQLVGTTTTTVLSPAERADLRRYHECTAPIQDTLIGILEYPDLDNLTIDHLKAVAHELNTWAEALDQYSYERNWEAADPSEPPLNPAIRDFITRERESFNLTRMRFLYALAHANGVAVYRMFGE